MGSKKKPAAKKAPAKKAAKIKPGNPKEYQLSDPTPELIVLVRDTAKMFQAEMNRAGLDEKQLAAKLKVSESRVWQLLDGRAISLRTVSEVLKVLGRRAKIEAV
jgi:ribosome-binding protein aMBF1 (putative translation factor)